MPFLSSPIAYPLSSDPPQPIERTHASKPDKKTNRKLGGFILDDEDSDHDDAPSASVARLQESIRTQDRVIGAFERDSMYQDDAVVESQTKSGNKGTPRNSNLSPEGTPSSSFARKESLGTPRPDGRKRSYALRTCSGQSFDVSSRSSHTPVSFEQLIASRSAAAAAGRAQKSYYGIEIHKLMDQAARETEEMRARVAREQEAPPVSKVATSAGGKDTMWTEKYRAKQFTDLVGDERTHRSVLRWLKRWDPIVFPGAARTKPKKRIGEDDEEKPHRKILLLTGPPGLGKTTLAHVCAKQAGYEILEINASDERSRDVVKGRIRDSVGTENVRGVEMKTAKGNVRKAGRPVCVIVDEVDGVVTGSSSGGEGGFIKALIDLVHLDQKNTSRQGQDPQAPRPSKQKKKGENFRLLRPLVLICNDVYHPALRPLRQSGLAEILHVRKPPLNMVSTRMKSIFDKEGLPCDGDAVRRLCEATWGMSSRLEAGAYASGSGEGDIRGVMVVGEWIAGKLRSSALSALQQTPRMTRRWVEEHVLGELTDGGGCMRGLGRGGVREIVEAVFLDGAGMTKPVSHVVDHELVAEPGSKLGVAEAGKKRSMDRLRAMVETFGECDRVVADCFSTYASQPIQDDTLLSKPNAAYDWLHFYDAMSTKVYAGQDWELAGYLSQPVLALHQLFSSPVRKRWKAGPEQGQTGDDNDAEEPLPFTGPRAEYQAREAEKENRSILSSVHSALSTPLLRCFRSSEDIATGLLPYLTRMLAPNVKPVVVGGSGDQRGMASVRREEEKQMVKKAVDVMTCVGVVFERGRVESDDVRGGNWVYRMEPPLDTLATFATAAANATGPALPTRYAIRQVLDQEHQRDVVRRQAEARQARYHAGDHTGVITAANAEDGMPRPSYSAEKENFPESNPLFGKVKPLPPTATATKRDFFGRVIVNEATRPHSPTINEDDGTGTDSQARKKRRGEQSGADSGTSGAACWVSYHEGFSNAVRKPISLDELLRVF